MGVTIHFEGQVRNADAFVALIDTARDFAEHQGWTIIDLQKQKIKLQRNKNEQPVTYVGPTAGLEILIDDNCESLNLEFDKNFYIQEFVKTQFADQKVHKLIVALLREIEKYFEHLTVDDEGEYWDTGDALLLEYHLTGCFRIMEELVNEDSTLQGPFRGSDGRIIDLMSVEDSPPLSARERETRPIRRPRLRLRAGVHTGGRK